MDKHISEIHMRWLGVAGFEFKNEDQTILVDPFLTRPPFKFILGGKAKPNREIISNTIQEANHILVTHAHYDHLMDVPVVARRTGAQVHGSANVCQLLKAFELPAEQIHEINANEIISLPHARIEIIHARHPAIPGYLSGKLKKNIRPPLHLRDYRMDECFSFLINLNKIKLLIWSSASTQNAQPADVLFFRTVADLAWYQEILNIVQPRLVIPTHWDDLFRPLSNPVIPFFAPSNLRWPPIRKINLGQFKDRIHQAKPGCRILIPDVLRTYNLMDEME